MKRILYISILLFGIFSYQTIHGQYLKSKEPVLINHIDSNGMKQGLWVETYENGNVKEIIYYKDDLLDGIYIHFYENCKIEQIKFWSKGKRNGIARGFDEHGVLNHYLEYRLDTVYYSRSYYKGVLWQEQSLDPDTGIHHNFDPSGNGLIIPE